MILSYLKIRGSKLQNPLGVYLVMLLDILIAYFAYKNQVTYLFIAIISYGVFILFLPNLKYKTLSYFVYDGMLDIIKSIEQRGGIINFYFFIISLSYILSLYMIFIHDVIGYLCFSLIYLLKIIIYYLFYSMSKKKHSNL